MSHIKPEAVLSDPVGSGKVLIEIVWRLPFRVCLALRNNIFTSSQRHPRTSLRLAIATSVFAPTLAHNWHLLLARPTSVEPRTGLLYPEDLAEDDADKDRKHGFHGFLYTAHKSPEFGQRSVEGADVIWIHAHGGGFYAGEARQYHYTYMRWVDKAFNEFGLDMRILAVEYPLSTVKPYPGCINSIYAAYQYVIESGISPSQIIIAGDSAGGNGALSTCYKIIEEKSFPSPVGLIMLSPWLDLTRSTSGQSPNQPTDWLTTFDSEECRTGAIEVYMGTTIKSSSDPRVSPLFRNPSKALPKQFLSAGDAEVLFADSVAWAEKVRKSIGKDAIECHFAKDQVHTFAIGGWLADPEVLEVSDWRLLSFVKERISANHV